MSRSRKLAVACLWGCLALVGLIGVAQLLWAAVPSGAPVLYTASDAVVLPTGVTFTAPTLQAGLTFRSQGSSALTGDLSPAQLTLDQHNYNPDPSGIASILRLSSNASRNITGLQGGSDGRVLLLINVGVQNIVLVAESTLSTDIHRFDFSGDLTLPPKAVILLAYDATSLRWRTMLAVPPAGPFTTSVMTMSPQATDPSVTGLPVGYALVYNKGGTIFSRDWLGNVLGPFGAGGGGPGPSGGTGVTVRLATTAEINLTTGGELTIDGVTATTGTRVLVKNQTTQTQNGIYVSQVGQWQRANDFDLASEFIEGFTVHVTGGTSGGTGNKNTLWGFSTLGSIILGTTNLTFVKIGLGPTGELIANRSTLTTSTPNGTIGSDSNGRVPWNRAGSYAIHADLAATSQITPTAQTMGIQSSTAINVTLTTGNPRITGCTAAADGIHLTLVGLDPTKTVTMPNGQGVLLAGAMAGTPGAVIIGRAPGGTSATFRCNGGTTTWEQVHVPTLQQSKNAGRDLDGMVDEATGMRRGDISGGTYCVDFGATTKCYCAGVPCGTTPIANAQFTAQGSQPTCDAARRFVVWVTAASTGTATADKTEICDKDAGDVYAWKVFGAGAGANTACMTKDAVSSADTNRLMGSVGRAITLLSLWCNYEGSAPSTIAQFTIVGATLSGAPVCAAPTAAATPVTITAGGAKAARVPIRWSVTNSPSPTSESYSLCVSYAVQ